MSAVAIASLDPRTWRDNLKATADCPLLASIVSRVLQHAVHLNTSLPVRLAIWQPTNRGTLQSDLRLPTLWSNSMVFEAAMISLQTRRVGDREIASDCERRGLDLLGQFGTSRTKPGSSLLGTG